MIDDIAGDVRALVAQDGYILTWMNVILMTILGMLFTAALAAMHRQRRLTVNHATELSELIEVRTKHLRDSLIENKHQLDVLTEANTRIQILYEFRDKLAAATQEFVSSGDYKRFYRFLVDDLMLISGARYGAFGLFSADSTMSEFFARGISEEDIRAIGKQPEGKGLIQEIYARKTAIRLDNIQNDPRACGFPPGHPPMGSLLGVPVIIDGRTRGVIYLADKPDGNPFSESDQKLVEIYANEVAHVLKRQDLLSLLQRDIVERLLVEEKLSKAMAHLRSIIDNSPAIIFTTDPAIYTPKFVSENIERILGLCPEDFIGDADSWRKYIHPEDMPRLMKEFGSLKEKKELVLELRFRSPDGSYRWIRNNLRLHCSDDGNPIEIFGVLTDVTERKLTEEEMKRQHDVLLKTNKRLEEAHNQLLQSEKMAAIGQLAAGVAHEINNPVGYVNSNIGTLNRYISSLFRLLDAYAEMEATPEDATRAAMAKIESIKREVDLPYLRKDIMDLLRESQEGVDRVNQIVRDLKDFSHVDDQEWTWADLHHGIDSTLNIVHNEIKYKARVIKEYDDIPRIECRPHQLNQVFMNLLVNAAYAIKENGTIWVRTGTDQDWIWIEIEDTGHGIAPEHLNRIFDPFFSTKPMGKGTGLGLSLSYGIVHKHGGHIEVDSTVGKGTRFRVWLPLHRPMEAAVGA